jgi:O-antigen/teichoic acid export membrane protein
LNFHFLKKGHERSLRIKKNVVASFFLSAVGIVIAFVRVPVILDYLDVSEYGIWLVLTSMVSWFGFLNLGLGNGLRNKLAVALAKDDLGTAKILVSTTYASLVIIIFIIYCVFICIQPLLNWTDILNAPNKLGSQLPILVFIFATSYAIEFVVNLMDNILEADQRPAIGRFIGTTANIVFLLVLIFLNKNTPGSLIYMAIAFFGSSILVTSFSSIYLFCGRYDFLRPSFRCIKFGYISEIGGLGVKFFVLQLAAIILFTSDNMIITQFMGPEEVTAFNIAKKYMGVALMGFGIVVDPLWSAFTDAFTRKDIAWIKWVMKKTIMLWGALLVFCTIQFLFSQNFYFFWIGDKVDVPRLLTLLMALFTVVSCWNLPFVYFLNGIGKIRLQLYIAIFIILANIPLSIYFAQGLGMGSSGVILATSVCLMIGSILSPIQYYKIINNTATGIWAK